MNTEKERQHYVPKYYLKKFSINNNQGQIGCFNVQNESFCNAAKLKTQAYKPYFYGKDGILEDLIGTYEDEHARLITKIIEELYIPQKFSSQHVSLITLLCLTDVRNPVSSDYLHKSFGNIQEIIQEKVGEKKKFIKENLSITDAVHLSFSSLKTSIECCGDLHFKLIINNSKTPFITSDNPLAKYNQFLELRNYTFGGTGLGNIGLQMFFALSPEKMIIAYDPVCYKVGSSHKKILNTSLDRDIYQLNLLQFINCNSTLYFNEKITRNSVNELFITSKRYQKANEVVTKQFLDFDKRKKTNDSSIVILTMTTDAKIKLKLSFINLLDSAKFMKIDNSKTHLRPFAHEILDARHK